MNENVCNKFISYKKKNLKEYAKIVIQMLLSEKKIQPDEKSYYLNTTKELVDKYAELLYFSLDDTFTNIKALITNFDSDNIKKAASITHVCIELDKLLNPINLNKISLNDLKQNIVDLLKLLNIDVESKNNKELISSLSKILRQNYHTEYKFFQGFKEIENIENVYIREPLIKDTFLVRFDYKIEGLDVFYKEQVVKVLNSNNINYEFSLMSYHLLSITILKELLLRKKHDNFIVEISKDLFESNKKINDLKKMFINETIKKAIFLLIDYEDYLKYQSKINILKEFGFNYLLDYSNYNKKINVESINEGELILVNNLFYENDNDFDLLEEKNIIVIEKQFDKNYSEDKLLDRKMED